MAFIAFYSPASSKDAGARWISAGVAPNTAPEDGRSPEHGWTRVAVYESKLPADRSDGGCGRERGLWGDEL